MCLLLTIVLKAANAQCDVKGARVGRKMGGRQEAQSRVVRRARPILNGGTQARALDQEGRDALWMHLYGSEDFPKRRACKPAFQVGDYVIVARTRTAFEKRSQANIWSVAKYRVKDVDAGLPPMYTIEDAKGKLIGRRLYGSEMQRTTPPSAATKAAAAAAATDDAAEEESTKDDTAEGADREQEEKEGEEEEGAEQDLITEIIGERGSPATGDHEYKVEWYASSPSWVDASVISHKGLLRDWTRRQKAGDSKPKSKAAKKRRR